MPYVQVNGFRTYYEAHGSGPPVLYIHGGMGGIRSLLRPAWDATETVPGFRFIFYDRRGCGRSEAPGSGYDLPTFANDAAGILEHLGIDQAIVLGSSAGGPIALQLAVEQPERAAGLILANTSARLWREEIGNGLVQELLDVLENEGAEAAYEKRPEHVRHSLEPLWRWPEAEAHGWLDRSIQEEEELARRAAAFPEEERLQRHVAELLTCRAYMGVDLTSQLSKVSCPALVVHGATDRVVPFSGSRGLVAHLPTAELVAIPEAGHMILNHPEAQQAVERFLHRLANKGPSMR